jgi:AAA+ superfamily predicted ATPase
LTAEAIADQTQQPLYHLQAEELGTKAAELGGRLKSALELVTDWNAILLLDEADVFLSRRSLGDFQRNELVSIFLRSLEYFDGIMFLTTNLREDIDEAFESRIHLHLLFPSLDRDARLLVWQKFVSRFPDDIRGHLSDDDLQEIAAYELNGRQIKTVLKTTRAWCMCKGEKVSLARCIAGIQITAPRAKKEKSHLVNAVK